MFTRWFRPPPRGPHHEGNEELQEIIKRGGEFHQIDPHQREHMEQANRVESQRRYERWLEQQLRKTNRAIQDSIYNFVGWSIWHIRDYARSGQYAFQMHDPRIALIYGDSRTWYETFKQVYFTDDPIDLALVMPGQGQVLTDLQITYKTNRRNEFGAHTQGIGYDSGTAELIKPLVFGGLVAGGYGNYTEDGHIYVHIPPDEVY